MFADGTAFVIRFAATVLQQELNNELSTAG